uniref:Uncharacterized protein n=1 Tax=Vitis vinifera TaxID=29760 RepID=A5BPN4_VITVI|nr:hypothetical protein VITISV_004846 [Vitis vinifera]
MGFENGHRRVAMQIGIMYVGPRHNWYRTVRLVIAATIISEFPLLPTAMFSGTIKGIEPTMLVECNQPFVTAYLNPPLIFAHAGKSHACYADKEMGKATKISGSLLPTMNPYGLLVVKQVSKCGESSSPRDCEECLWSWFSRLMDGTFQS